MEGVHVGTGPRSPYNAYSVRTFTQSTTPNRPETKRSKERSGPWTRSKSQKTRLTPTTTETYPPKPPPPRSSTSPNHPLLHKPPTIPSRPHLTALSPSNKELITGCSLATMLKFWSVATCVSRPTVETCTLIIVTMADRRRSEDVRRI